MATLFKPTRPYPLPPNPEVVGKDGRPHVRVREKGKVVFYPLTEDGTKCLKPAAKWAADVRFADGTRRRVRFSPNRDASAQMLAELLKRIENEKAGIVDRTAQHRKRPLTAHLDDWQASLRAAGRGEDYVALKPGRVRAVVGACGWVFPGDMAADRAEAALAGLRARRPELPAIPAGVEAFTVGEVGRLLGGVGRQTVAALIRRHRLTGTGRGKGRRFPREAVEALRAAGDRGLSSQTANHYLGAVKQFAKWMVENERLGRNPFARLKPLNARLDQRRRRGELTPAELAAVLAAAAASPVAIRGLAGEDRAMLYRVAVGTGFRAAELAGLVPDFFDLDAAPPAVVLPAELSKNRKGAVQPLPAGLTADLRAYLAGRPGREPVWPGSWVGRAAVILRADLDAAGVPVEVDGPEGVETRDFHALRAVYISDVIRAGADLKQAMTLARHSDPRLTTARYARTRLHDLGAVVDKLPTQTTSGPPAYHAVLKMTGTDPAVRDPGRPGAATGAAAGDAGRGRLRVVAAIGDPGTSEPAGPNSCERRGLGNGRGDVREDEGRGPARIRTGGDGFANRCLTTWRPGRVRLGES